MKITFHVLEKSDNQQALLHVCQLAETHYEAGESTYIHVANQQEADRLDQLLWTFKDNSFIPHQVCPAESNPPLVLIGYEPHHAAKAKTVINLTNDIPTFINQYEQVIEIVFADPVVQQLARERFKKYRELGQEITTHKL